MKWPAAAATAALFHDVDQNVSCIPRRHVATRRPSVCACVFEKVGGDCVRRLWNMVVAIVSHTFFAEAPPETFLIMQTDISFTRLVGRRRRTEVVERRGSHGVPFSPCMQFNGNRRRLRCTSLFAQRGDGSVAHHLCTQAAATLTCIFDDLMVVVVHGC